MNKFYYIIALSFLAISLNGNAQQEAYFLNNINNQAILNPAAGGLTGVAQIELTSRSQWLGYNGGPRSFMLTGNSQIRTNKEQVLSEFNKDDKALFSSPINTVGKIKHIVGGKVMNDAIGPFAKSSVHGNYAIHLPFSKKLNFGVGIGLGWSNFRIDQDRVSLYEENDIAYANFVGQSSSQNFLDANAGIIFYGEKFSIGLSSTQVFKNKAQLDELNTANYYNRHYFGSIKYAFAFGQKIGFEPAVIAKYAEGAPFSFDAGARFTYNSSVWLGGYYRTGNSIAIQAGVNIIKNFYVSYGYEMSTGILRTSGNGTHEVQLGIYIGNNKNKNVEDGHRENTEETK